jgi:hypothetical protein
MGALEVPVFSALTFLCVVFAPCAGYSEKAFSECKTNNPTSASFHDFKANLLNGTEVNFSHFKDKVVLVVNVATF